MIEYLNQFTANDLVMIHCAVMLIAIFAIMSVSLLSWLVIHAYEILSVTWYETKRRRHRAAKLSKLNGIYTVNK